MGAGKPLFPKMKNFIFARTLPSGPRDGMEFVSENPADFVARLKEQPGKDIWLCGGGELARAFIQARALDEITLGIVPMLVGAGLPTFRRNSPKLRWSSASASRTRAAWWR